MALFVKAATVPSTNCTSNSSSFIDNNMPWDCILCRYPKQARHQEQRIRCLGCELKSVREEICILKAVNGNSNFVEQGNLNTWCKCKNSISGFCRFSAADASEVKLSNRFSILKTNTLEAVQQNQVC
jgi:hypothetical protein